MEEEYALAHKEDNVQERTAWSTEKINELMNMIDEGYKPKSTPFYEGNPTIRKGNIIFDYTDFEISEIRKCAKDIVYFANKYCTVMTDEGLRTIVLRDYQEKMLRHFVDNRFSICLAARQTGKCFFHNILITIKLNDITLINSLSKFKNKDNTYTLPIFELYYVISKTNKTLSFLDKIKYYLYKTYSYLSRS